MSVLGLVLTAGAWDGEARSLYVPLPGSSSSSMAPAVGAVVVVAVQQAGGDGGDAEAEEQEQAAFMHKVKRGGGRAMRGGHG